MKALHSRNIIRRGADFYLRSLTPADVSEEYVGWLNCPETSQYLESRYQRHTPESTAAFVQAMYESESNAMLGMFWDERHVGNIKIGNISPLYAHADIGLIVGKPYWGLGFGSAAIGLAEEIAFGPLNLHKLFAGAYAANAGSVAAFMKNGWRIIGEQKEHYKIGDRYIDGVLMEKLRSDAQKQPG